VSAFAAIPQLFGGSQDISFEKKVDASTTDPNNISIPPTVKFAESFRHDGFYEVDGSLFTGAGVGRSSSSKGSAVADFFCSFSVGVVATPVPETINVVGAFAVAGFCGYIWFRRSRALRCS
jgi:hypothetical protein